MELGQIRTFRLVDRGGAGLSCDPNGISLGGFPLASADSSGGSRRYIVMALGKLGDVLSAAYGPQRADEVQRRHRGLRRVASALEADDLALAGIEAVMLALPELGADAMAKLASLADLEKGGDAWLDEPRLPAGEPGGGQWTSGGGTASAELPASSGQPGADVRDGASSSPGSEQHRDDDLALDQSTLAPPPRRLGMPNLNGFYPDGAGGGVFYIPSVSAGRDIRPTEVHALNPNAFQVGWTADSIHLKDVSGDDVYVVSAAQPAIEQFNQTAGRTLGVRISAFPADVTPARPGAFDWLLQPGSYDPIKPEIAAGEPSIPGAALEETTDPNAFEAWRPVSHLETMGNFLGVAGALAPVARLPAAGSAAIEAAEESQLLAAEFGRNAPGIVTLSGDLSPASGGWLRVGVPTPIPSQVGDALVGRQFNTFQGFRAAFWRSVAGQPELTSEFDTQNLANIRRGYAPFAPTEYQANTSDAGMRFNLHHEIPIEDGGPVYDLGNIKVTDPSTHRTIHYGPLKRWMEAEMVKRLTRDELVSLIEVVTSELRTDVSSQEINNALLLFCANCPDPVAAMRLMVSDMTPRTDEQLVDFALAMPKRDVRDVPVTELLPSHPLRYMRLDQ